MPNKHKMSTMSKVLFVIFFMGLGGLMYLVIEDSNISTIIEYKLYELIMSHEHNPMA